MTGPEPRQARLAALLRRAPVVPVLTIDDPSLAVPLARALVRGGLPVLEVTLRTTAAEEAIARIAAQCPDAIVGAGTVNTPEQLRVVESLGAAFAVSPGTSPGLLEAIADSPVPFLPGIATASEAMALAERGHLHLKFFPAEASGGVAALKALAGPLPDLVFCPTGGIDAARATSYLACANVACVGGSWVTPAEHVGSGDWEAISRLAAEAAALRP